MFLAEKRAFSLCFIQNWEEFESLKNDKSPGKVLEFCFPISVQTLKPSSAEGKRGEKHERRDKSPRRQRGWRITPEKCLNFERFYVRFNVVLRLGPGFSHIFCKKRYFFNMHVFLTLFTPQVLAKYLKC